MVGMAHGRTHPPAGPLREPRAHQPAHRSRRQQRWRGSRRMTGCSTCGSPRWAAQGRLGGGQAWSPTTRDRGIRVFVWAHDGRHLLYLQDTGGDENWRLYAVDLHDDAAAATSPRSKGSRSQIIAAEKKYPTERPGRPQPGQPELHDVYRLDLLTGELVKEVENPGFVGLGRRRRAGRRCGRRRRSRTAAWCSWSATAPRPRWRLLLDDRAPRTP